MPDDRTSIYRGPTREDVERAYHEQARSFAADGYAPTSENWSTALGQQVLTVTFVHDPGQSAAVLAALSSLSVRPAPEPVSEPAGAERSNRESGLNRLGKGVAAALLGLFAIGVLGQFLGGSRGDAAFDPTSEPTQRPTARPTSPLIEPTVRPTVAPLPTDSITAAQENAIEAARDYLDFAAFSRSGLIGQLEYEGYATADATFAVDSLPVDWNEQAYLSAKAYLDFSSFSLQGLIEQLEYEGFTTAQAKYGAERAYSE